MPLLRRVSRSHEKWAIIPPGRSVAGREPSPPTVVLCTVAVSRRQGLLAVPASRVLVQGET